MTSSQANESQALVRSAATDELIRPTPMLTLKERRAHIVEAMRDLMVEGQHYGRIPNTGDKQVLMLPGAQTLCSSVGLGPKYEIERIDLANGHRENQVLCTLINTATGVTVGQGVGSCSSMEAKYRWRRGERVCPKCSQATIIRGKADYGGGWLCFAKKGGCGAKWPDGAPEIESQPAGRVENPDIADCFNTVLKMAKKRAFVDAVITTLAASDLFTQDIEDVGPDDREDHSPPRNPAPRSRSASSSTEITREPSEDWIIDMIGRIDESESADELKKLASTINSTTPRGSPARRAVKAAYDERMRKLV